MTEVFWYRAIRDYATVAGTFTLENESTAYTYVLESRYPKFTCKVYERGRVIDVNVRIYYKPGQWVEDKQGNIGMVQESDQLGPYSTVKWSPSLVSNVLAKDMKALREISIGLICNASFDQCRKDKMRVTLQTKSLTNRKSTQWLVIIQRMSNQFKWIRLANLEPMRDPEFEYWWARPQKNGWNLLRPASYTNIHDFWETRIIKDPTQGVAKFPSGGVQRFGQSDIPEKSQQNAIVKVIRKMFQKRHLLKPNAKRPIRIPVHVLKKSFSDILKEIQMGK